MEGFQKIILFIAIIMLIIALVLIGISLSYSKNKVCEIFEEYINENKITYNIMVSVRLDISDKINLDINNCIQNKIYAMNQNFINRGN